MFRIEPVLKPLSVSARSWVVTPKWYGLCCVRAKIVSENVKSPTGSWAASAVMISPRPWPKSVATDVCRCSYVRTSPSVYVARTREVDIGCVRP